MDPFTAGKVAEFLQVTGPWGMVAVCFVVIGVLWRYSISLQDKLVAAQEKLALVQDKRVTDTAALAAQTATGLATSSATTAAQADETATVNRLLQQILDIIRLLPGSVEAGAIQSNNNTARILEALNHRGRS